MTKLRKQSCVNKHVIGGLRVCSHGGGGSQKGEVPHLPEVRKTWPSHAIPGRWGEVLNAIAWNRVVAEYVHQQRWRDGRHFVAANAIFLSYCIGIFSGSFSVMRVNVDLFNPRKTSNSESWPRSSKSM